jgi:hypothetical protein
MELHSLRFISNVVYLVSASNSVQARVVFGHPTYRLYHPLLPVPLRIPSSAMRCAYLAAGHMDFLISSRLAQLRLICASISPDAVA